MTTENKFSLLDDGSGAEASEYLLPSERSSDPAVCIVMAWEAVISNFKWKIGFVVWFLVAELLHE